MKLNQLLVFISTTLLTILCSCENIEYEYSFGVVVDTKHNSWGRGYYELEVYYKYFDGQDYVIGHSTADDLEKIYTRQFIPGDSVLIGFDPTDSSETYIVKKTYAVPRFQN